MTRNQRVGGGLWHYLGSYAFDPLTTPMVSLAANDNGSVAADALRFVGGPGGATDIAYLHNDHLGTPQVMTDASAQVLWWRDQTPFGQTVAEGGFSASQLRFPGQYADAESGLAYNYFRDYDPALGRYIQSDPIGLGGGLNTYGYVRANPMRYVDPKGERGLPGAAYGLISGFVGGYTASGDFRGAATGAAVGAFIGFVAPGQSQSAGAAAAAARNAGISAIASVLGQIAGNYVADKNWCDLRNYSAGAVAGAALGGAIGAPVNGFLGRFLPVLRPPVIGNPVGTGVRRWPGNLAGAVAEGAAVGGGEMAGSAAERSLILGARRFQLLGERGRHEW